METLLNNRYAYFTRMLPDGRVLDVIPLTFGRARLVLGPNQLCGTYDNGW